MQGQIKQNSEKSKLDSSRKIRKWNKCSSAELQVQGETVEGFIRLDIKDLKGWNQQIKIKVTEKRFLDSVLGANKDTLIDEYKYWQTNRLIKDKEKRQKVKISPAFWDNHTQV